MGYFETWEYPEGPMFMWEIHYFARQSGWVSPPIPYFFNRSYITEMLSTCTKIFMFFQANLYLYLCKDIPVLQAKNTVCNCIMLLCRSMYVKKVKCRPYVYNVLFQNFYISNM
jgi:hypothetical protein